MINPVAAMVALILSDATAELTALKTAIGSRAAGHDTPEGTAEGIDAAARVVVEDIGSAQGSESPVVDVALTVRCYGASQTGAMAVYQLVHGALHGLVNKSASGVRWVSLWVEGAGGAERTENNLDFVECRVSGYAVEA